MPKKNNDIGSSRKTKKNSRKNTFNKYGKNTSRSTRIKLTQLENKDKNKKLKN